MKEVWYRIFVPLEPSPTLGARIAARIALLERRAARLRVAAWGASTLLFALLLIPALGYANQQFYASGFFSYLSLLSSDQGLVLTYWREFVLSLAESLPSLALLLLIPLFLAFVWSARRTLRTARGAFVRA